MRGRWEDDGAQVAGGGGSASTVRCRDAPWIVKQRASDSAWSRISHNLRAYLDRSSRTGGWAPLGWVLVGVPLLLGRASVLLGQDTNWDLRNYHLYGPYALLTGRLGKDLAPAMMQSYFNPLLDVPYYLLAMHGPPRLAAFVMGAWQGLVFVALVGIAHEVLPPMKPDVARRDRLAVLLALAGVAASGFLSLLGNTMGDNTTAVLVLAALYGVLRALGTGRRGDGRLEWGWLLAAGAVMGAAVGLKLTNVIYAVALAAALFALPIAWLARARAEVVFALGGLIGTLATGGFWWLRMWRTFRNPFFPLFNGIFKSPMMDGESIGATRYHAQNHWEKVIWPLVTAADPKRLGELAIWQIVWPVLFVLVVAWGCRALYTSVRPRADEPSLAPAARIVIAFLIVAYLAWMLEFNIYRYAIAMSLVAPLGIWLLFARLVHPSALRRAATGTLIACAIVGLAGFTTWGQAPWAATSFRVDPPIAFDDPSHTTIILAGEDAPYGFVVTLLPAELSFVSIGRRFSESPAYNQRLWQIVTTRGGPVYALIGAAQERPGDTRDRTMPNRGFGMHESVELQRHGLALERESCAVHSAYIGAMAFPFQLCRLVVPPADSRRALGEQRPRSSGR